MDYKIIPKRANRCDECKRIIRNWNQSGLYSACQSRKNSRERRKKDEEPLH